MPDQRLPEDIEGKIWDKHNSGIFSHGAQQTHAVGHFARYARNQIRQNTRSTRASSRQALIDTFYDHAWKLGSDAELNTIIRAGLADFDTLSDENKFRFNNLISRFEGNLYNGILLHEDGLLDGETLHEIGDRFVSSLATKGGKAWYESVGGLTLRVKQYVETRKNAHRNSFPSYGVDSNKDRA